MYLSPYLELHKTIDASQKINNMRFPIRAAPKPGAMEIDIALFIVINIASDNAVHSVKKESAIDIV